MRERLEIVLFHSETVDLYDESVTLYAFEITKMNEVCCHATAILVPGLVFKNLDF